MKASQGPEFSESTINKSYERVRKLLFTRGFLKARLVNYKQILRTFYRLGILFIRRLLMASVLDNTKGKIFPMHARKV
jgi:hypothetical protein